jgi:hypothetical protein
MQTGSSVLRRTHPISDMLSRGRHELIHKPATLLSIRYQGPPVSDAPRLARQRFSRFRGNGLGEHPFSDAHYDS